MNTLDKLVIVVLAFALVGCAELFYAPPPFAGETFTLDAEPDPAVVRERDDLIRDEMWNMANFVQALGSGLSAQESGARDRLVVGALSGLETHATDLLNGDDVLGHPVLGAELPDYVAEVSEARRAAELVPPDFVPAETLLGGCGRCHELRLQPN